MPTPYNDRWERTKRYLLWNFLVNPGFQLSPITEEERSSPDSDSLPDLIVEPEPNRHYHSPASYVRLEQRMRRLYRQLFLDENVNHLPTQTAVELNKQDGDIEEPETDVHRLLTASKFTRIRIDKTINSQLLVNVVATQKDQEDVVTRSHEVNAEGKIQVSDNEIDIEDLINLGVDRQDKTTEILGIQNTSIDLNKDDDENRFDNALRKGKFAGKARQFISQSSNEESFEENLEPIAHSTVSEDVEPFEVMRDARVTGANVSWHGEMEQASPMLAFQTKRSADRPEDVSSDSNDTNASLNETETEIREEEQIEKNIEEGEEIEVGEESENEIVEEEAEVHLTPNPHARIIDEFWSVSPIEMDTDNLAKNVKRKSDSNDDAPASKRKKHMATQTCSGDKSEWHLRNDFFARTPLVYQEQT